MEVYDIVNGANAAASALPYASATLRDPPDLQLELAQVMMAPPLALVAAPAATAAAPASPLPSPSEFAELEAARTARTARTRDLAELLRLRFALLHWTTRTSDRLAIPATALDAMAMQPSKASFMLLLHGASPAAAPLCDVGRLEAALGTWLARASLPMLLVAGHATALAPMPPAGAAGTAQTARGDMLAQCNGVVGATASVWTRRSAELALSLMAAPTAAMWRLKPPHTVDNLLSALSPVLVLPRIL